MTTIDADHPTELSEALVGHYFRIVGDGSVHHLPVGTIVRATNYDDDDDDSTLLVTTYPEGDPRGEEWSPILADEGATRNIFIEGDIVGPLPREGAVPMAYLTHGDTLPPGAYRVLPGAQSNYVHCSPEARRHIGEVVEVGEGVRVDADRDVHLTPSGGDGGFYVGAQYIVREGAPKAPEVSAPTPTEETMAHLGHGDMLPPGRYRVLTGAKSNLSELSRAPARVGFVLEIDRPTRVDSDGDVWVPDPMGRVAGFYVGTRYLAPEEVSEPPTPDPTPEERAEAAEKALADFRDLVRRKVIEEAAKHGWCTRTDEWLRELGLPDRAANVPTGRLALLRYEDGAIALNLGDEGYRLFTPNGQRGRSVTREGLAERGKFDVLQAGESD